MKKSNKKVILTATLIFCSMLLSAQKFQEFIKSLNDNDLIKNLKKNLTAYVEARKPERIYLHTDKTLYKPTETIWLEAYLRNETDLQPSQASQILYVELIEPKGNVSETLKLIAQNGKASGSFELASEMAGGIYKLKAYTNWQKNDENALVFEKEITVQKVVLPRLKMKLDFEKQAYGAADKVEAILKLQSLDNKALQKHDFNFVVMLNGEKIKEDKLNTDSQGNAIIKFELPKDLDTNDGLLNIMIPYNGSTESISRSIPIVLNKIDLAFFPEGGDMVAGLDTKVAFKATNEFGKAADISGIVLDKNNNKVAELESFHKGLGAFSFKPEKDQAYKVQITSPKNIAKTYDLPSVLPLGYVLNAATAKKTLKVEVQTTQKDEELSVVAQMRSKLYYSNAFKAKKGTSVLEIPTENLPMGVLQITLFDSKGIERAERLVFVNADKQLNIKVSTDKEKYLPREKVKMSLEVTDERGLPMPSQLSLAVVDDKLLSYKDDRQGHILSKLLLEPDLQGEIDEPNFYFDKNEPKAQKALDFLMLTHGWRRFVWEKIQKNESFTPQFQAEKALIGGQVFLGNKATKAKYRYDYQGKTYEGETDDKGNFQIKDVFLYDVLEIRFERQNSTSLHVNEYRTDYKVHIPEYVVRTMAMQEKKARRGGVVVLGDMVEDGVRAAAENWLEHQDMAEAMELEAAKEFVQKLDLDVDFEIQEPQAEVAAKIEVADDEFGGDEPKDVIPQNTLYHRAKEFPKMNYSNSQNVELRTDFRSTVFWQGNLETDKKGKAQIEFYNSDEVTAFRATVEGIGADGLVGHSEYVYFTQLPFSMSVKVPNQVTMGDNLQIPLTLTNNSDKNLEGKLEITSPTAWKAGFELSQNQSLKAGETKTIFLPFEVLNQLGKGKFVAKFESKWAKDAFEQEVEIGQKGFPVTIAMSGTEAEKSFKFNIDNPVQGTLQATFTAFPTSLSDLMAGIEGILAEPYGCFEQTSSSTYPNIMVLNYLKESDSKDQALKARAKELIDKGYKRLVSFETPEKGYEWFGGTPAHEALTAYGLMEFRDMQAVYEKVDENMIKRTAEWLLKRKDGKGGFERNPRALDSFGGADKDITDAYIVYALSEAGFDSEKLRNELEKAYENALKSQDAYQLGLVTNALFNLKDNRFEKTLEILVKLQKDDGSWEGKNHSITRSTGIGLKIETTSLACLALLKQTQKNVIVLEKGIKAIVQNRSPYGGFGNTQSTVLALKALTEFAKFSKRTTEAGDIEIVLNGKKIAEKHYEKDLQDAIVVSDLAKDFKMGENLLTIKYKGVKNPIPYSVSVKYSTFLPQSSKDCPVKLAVNLKKPTAKVGETVRMTAVLENSQDKGQPMTLAIIGIPAGLSPQVWQLKELQDKKVCDFYEIIGNRIAFYYRQLKPNEKREINLDFKADIGGKYEGAASSAYLYYTNEHKTWVEALKMEIK